MNEEIAQRLRAPFPAEVVGKLPRVWCRKCGDNRKRGQHGCDQHQRARCDVCRNNITTAHLHLDYVGHAEVTDRLLGADPEWTWEPLAFDGDGLPAYDHNGGLWIKLTVAGVTRLGYGDAGDKDGPDAVKEVIGDALRNAAMRFGVAVDLWGATPKAGPEDGAPVSEQKPRRSPQEVAESGAEALLTATTGAGLQATAAKVRSSGVGNYDVTHVLSEAELDELGDLITNDRVTLTDLAGALVAYWNTNGHGPRQSEPKENAA